MARKEMVRLSAPVQKVENIFRLPGHVLPAHPPFPDGTFGAVLQGLREKRGPISKIIDEYLASESTEQIKRRKVS